MDGLLIWGMEIEFEYPPDGQLVVSEKMSYHNFVPARYCGITQSTIDFAEKQGVRGVNFDHVKATMNE